MLVQLTVTMVLNVKTLTLITASNSLAEQRVTMLCSPLKNSTVCLSCEMTAETPLIFLRYLYFPICLIEGPLLCFLGVNEGTAFVAHTDSMLDL